MDREGNAIGKEIESDAQISVGTRRRNRMTRRTLGRTTMSSDSDLNTQPRNTKVGPHQRRYERDSEETGHETDFASDAQGSAVLKRRKKCQVQTVFSVDAVHRIFSTFNQEKREIVQSIGFGCLLNLQPQVKFPRLLVLWLLKNMDAATGTITLPNGDELSVTEKDVQIVLGIPKSDSNVNCCYTLTSLDEFRVRHVLMMQTGDVLTLDFIETVLLRNYGEKMSERQTEAFKVAVVLYADAYFMAPKGAKVKLNQEIFKKLENTNSIQYLNWCGYVLRLLLQSADRVQQSILSGNKTVTLDGCLLFLVVFYLDNVDFGTMNSSHNLLPRIVDYPYALVKLLVRNDQQPKMEPHTTEYGRNKLRKAESVIYGRNPRATKDNTGGGHLKCHDSNSSERKLDDMIKAFNNWELLVNKATTETRSTMLEIMTSYAKTREEEKTVKISPDGGTGERCNADVTDRIMQANSLVPFGHDCREDKVSQCLQKCQYHHKKEIEYYIISDSEDSEDGKFHPGFDGIGRTRSDTWSTWSTDRMADRDEQLQMDLAKLDREREEQMLMELENLDHSYEEDDCPTPLSIRRNDAYGLEINLLETTDLEISEKVQAGKVMVINDIVVDATYFRNQTRFGVSPFCIGLAHKDAPLEVQLKLERALRQVKDEEKDGMWYIHEIPKIIQVHGKVLQKMFGGDSDLGITTINAIVRLYHQSDDEMYTRWTEKRWRHFLPVDFAVSAFRGDGFLASDEVKEMFLNYHITYNVAECRLVLAPLQVQWHWCLYVWDFERKRLIVLDPMDMPLGEHHMAEKHNVAVRTIHAAMEECKERYFPEACGTMEGWQIEYLTMPGAHGDSNHSGLYTMFYARHFDGQYLTRILTQEARQLHKSNMLWQLLTMFGNIGQPPARVWEAITGDY
ncbi:unnamed protein product [Urochloa decumbens]|uniref:Ubiquitin-like protease family profile domain-containing protein n=1 Tax=Urochloa decumbens TaxID=240449 RepID=A0ABC9C737_9POAL